MTPRTLEESKDREGWWFGWGSPVALGVFRIVICIVTFFSLLLTLFDFSAWYTEQGFLPLDVIMKNWSKLPATFQLGDVPIALPFSDFPRINLLGYSYDSRVTLAFYLLVMIAALLAAVGLWTRLSVFILAVGVVSIHHRNPLILHSGDSLLRICLLYLVVSPCGKACSVDRIIGLWRGKSPPEVPMVSLWPQRLIQFQVALVYFTTVWWKWFGNYWKDGTASWYPEHLNEFYRFPVPDFLHRQPFIALTTYGTLVVELSLATLVFYKPLRKYVLVAGLAMHGYIEYRFNIPFFAFIITSTYICFYEGDEITAWAKRVASRLGRLKLLVQHPKGSRMRGNQAIAIKSMDPFDLVAYEEGTDLKWRAFNRKSEERNPFRASVVRSVGAWPWGFFPGLWRRLLDRSLEPSEVSEPIAVATSKN